MMRINHRGRGLSPLILRHMVYFGIGSNDEPRLSTVRCILYNKQVKRGQSIGNKLYIYVGMGDVVSRRRDDDFPAFPPFYMTREEDPNARMLT